MQGRQKNRRLVAVEMTKFCENGKRSSEPLLKKRYSQALYNKGKELFLKALNRELPCPAFNRVRMPTGQEVWSPQNDAAEALLKAMTPEQCYEFITHEPPKAKPRECESKAILNGSRFKSLPNGVREADVFPSERSPKRVNIKPKLAEEYCGDGSEVDPAIVDMICQRISAGVHRG